MASSRARITELAKTYLDAGREPDFDLDFGDADISSMDALSFVKSISAELGVDIPAEEFAGFKNLQDIVDFVDTRS